MITSGMEDLEAAQPTACAVRIQPVRHNTGNLTTISGQLAHFLAPSEKSGSHSFPAWSSLRPPFPRSAVRDERARLPVPAQNGKPACGGALCRDQDRQDRLPRRQQGRRIQATAPGIGPGPAPRCRAHAATILPGERRRCPPGPQQRIINSLATWRQMGE
jgi:hypothetical protein